MKYIKIFGIEIGRYGWVRYDIPAFAIKFGYELGYKMFRIFGLTIITNMKMMNLGGFNEEWDKENLFKKVGNK